MEFRVSKNGKGTVYASIGAAVAALPKEDGERHVILVEPGIYEEVVEIRRSNVTVLGLGSPKETVIQYGNYANEILEDGQKRGTFRSYVMFLDGNGNRLENLTIRNTAYPRKKVGQALALYADGDMVTIRNCHLESFQDTLFTGPLPPAPMSPGGFIGPKEFDDRVEGRQFYDECVIKGDVDFIFGGAMAYFRNCKIVSRNGLAEADQAPENGILGYVTAASTPEGCPVGYVFDHCHFSGEDCPAGSFYLGRPWRNFAKTVLIDCELEAHIHPRGFYDWNKKEAHETMFYGEYQSHGPGAATEERADFVHQLGEKEASDQREFFRCFWESLT